METFNIGSIETYRLGKKASDMTKKEKVELVSRSWHCSKALAKKYVAQISEKSEEIQDIYYQSMRDALKEEARRCFLYD